MFARNYIHLVMRYNEADEASTEVKHAERSQVCCKKERVNHITSYKVRGVHEQVQVLKVCLDNDKCARGPKSICKIIGGIIAIYVE